MQTVILSLLLYAKKLQQFTRELATIASFFKIPNLYLGKRSTSRFGQYKLRVEGDGETDQGVGQQEVDNADEGQIRREQFDDYRRDEERKTSEDSVHESSILYRENLAAHDEGQWQHPQGAGHIIYVHARQHGVKVWLGVLGRGAGGSGIYVLRLVDGNIQHAEAHDRTGDGEQRASPQFFHHQGREKARREIGGRVVDGGNATVKRQSQRIEKTHRVTLQNGTSAGTLQRHQAHKYAKGSPRRRQSVAQNAGTGDRIPLAHPGSRCRVFTAVLYGTLYFGDFSIHFVRVPS